MMMSVQSLCMISTHIPHMRPSGTRPVASHRQVPSPCTRRAGFKWSPGFHEGRGGCRTTTWAALEQASSFFYNHEDAPSGGGVPSKDAGVHDITGTKTLELMDPIPSTKRIDDQLPPLISMIIDGLPPFQINEFVEEAERRLLKYVEHYPNVPSLRAFLIAGLSSTAYGHPHIISADRLTAISFNYALTFIVDDIFFDTPDALLREQYGISDDSIESPQKIRDYLHHLDAVFSLKEQPNPNSLIEVLTWESGQEMLALSNPEWFEKFAAALVEFHQTSANSHADIVEDRDIWFRDLDSYNVMRNGNVGGRFIHLILEFGKDTYMPDILRTSPFMEKVMTATSIHLGFVNDIFSYHKESLIEQNPRNFITVLMNSEGKSFVETVHMAIDLVNTYTRILLDLKDEAWNSTLQNHMHEVIALIAGNVYYSSMEKRYRQADSCFPELRDTTSSWKGALPQVKGR